MTLSNTYLSRKQLLADNLNSMGVLTVDADDGLTTLINAVLDIEPSIGGLDLDTAVSITASESTIIIGQSVVLTSKLTASYDDDTLVDVDLTGVLTGATIHFKEGNTVIGTGITDNSGVATATISNLTSGTHTIKAVFEGTENFNDCQSSNITITVNNPAPASITVSSDKPIMMKGETATITAKVLDSNGNPCEGETVSFEVVNGESLGSDVTDSSGEASVYYLGKDAYTLYIKGIVGSLEDSVEILDLFYYDTLTTNNNQYSTVSGSPVLTYGNNGLNVNTTLKQIGLVKNNFLTLPDNYEAEITITSQTASAGCGICFDDWLLDSGASDICVTYKLSTTTRLSNNLSKFQANNVVKIVKQGTSIKYYLNGTLKSTDTISDDTHLQHFRTYQNRSTTFKDLKIHEL